MVTGKRFKYALEPVLLTRKWDLDALLLDLSKTNEELTLAQHTHDTIVAQIAQLKQEWAELSQLNETISIDRFNMMLTYLGDLENRVKDQLQVILKIKEQRDALIDKVVASQKALEAVEEHKGQMRELFIKLRMSGEFKIADDQWNMMQSGEEKNGN